MKRNFFLIKSLIMLFAFTTICSPLVQAQRPEQQKFCTNDSINKISGTDTTFYAILKMNSNWSLLVSTSTITGTGGKVQIVVSHDGSTWFNYPDTNSVNVLFYDTIASNNRHVYTDLHCPYNYLGVKITKGTCKGKYSCSFVMKKPED
jgi:hypothetical protein